MVAAGCPAGQKTRALPDRRGGPVTYSALHVPLGRASRPSRAELAAVCLCASDVCVRGEPSCGRGGDYPTPDGRKGPRRDAHPKTKALLLASFSLSGLFICGPGRGLEFCKFSHRVDRACSSVQTALLGNGRNVHHSSTFFQSCSQHARWGVAGNTKEGGARVRARARKGQETRLTGGDGQTPGPCPRTHSPPRRITR